MAVKKQMKESASPPKEEKKKERKGKRERTGRKHSKVDLGKFYTIEGNVVTRSRKFCPRCGPGNFLAKNPKRLYCGKCGYTEFEKKSA